MLSGSERPGMRPHLGLQLAQPLLQGVVGRLQPPAVGQARCLAQRHIIGRGFD